jgi:hypothetical protein
MDTLEERIAKAFPDKDVRILSLEPLKVRYRHEGCIGTRSANIEATFENAKRLLLDCIKGLDG